MPEAEAERARGAGVDPDNTGLAVLSLIRAYGVDTVFGIPGTHNVEFYRHLRRLGMRAVTTRHEQGAGYAADGWSQRTRLPGVVITTSGPGLLNALSAAGTAYCESRPLIILAPGVPLGQEFADIGTLHETKDQLGAASAIVEWGRRVRSAEEAVAAVHDAFKLFRTSRPRPVYIEVPLDVLEGPADIDLASLTPRPLPPSAIAGPAEVHAAASALRTARQPVILAGGGSVGAGDELQTLAEYLGVPVVTTLNGKGVLPESHALSLGSGLRLDAVRRVVNGSDALLVVGSKLGETELWDGELAPQGTVIRVDILASQAHKNLAATHALIGDASAVLAQLSAVLGAEPGGPASGATPWCDLAEVREATARDAAEFAELEDRVAGRIASTLPPDAVVTGDSSQITYYGMASRVRPDEPGAFMYMATYATLGYGLPAAIGAKIASPERPVVGVIGDGALMFSIQELQTAVEQRLDLTIVCIDNGGYGEIEQNQADRGIDPIGVRLAQPNWPALVEAFGGHGYAVSDPDTLEAVIATALAASGVTLVHVDLGMFETASD
ncbi:thiamine pyrophosphate-binding protein [Streptomyces sp. NPDC052042]|uniref:thiamine pyrophosphate-binding protein n=1 Tax=Streptomyces sp. NPDC052042 TaxID=3365683 RepID=UPI0037D8935F